MHQRVLISWIGKTDLNYSEGKETDGVGPIAEAVRRRSFDCIELLSNYAKNSSEDFSRWLSKHTAAGINLRQISKKDLPDPTDYRAIYATLKPLLEAIKKSHGVAAAYTFHLSPGTPAMAAIWIILSRSAFPAELIQTSKDKGVKTVSLPFDLAAEPVDESLHEVDSEITRLIQGLPPAAPAFEHIIHRCDAMKRVVAQARRLAQYDVPVLILGESGTGKELFARAIHAASRRAGEAIIPVNCAAIPETLLESELFGHEKGAFTGASKQRKGVFERADGGTVFLDEIGDMAHELQAKLLRVLNDGTFTRLGGEQELKADVRIIAATNRDLMALITEGAFREDLFYRLAVGVIAIPPLRERHGDLTLLINAVFAQVMSKFTQHKKLSPKATNLLLQHQWPGNVRELWNTLSRAAIWSSGDTLDEHDVQRAFLMLGCSSNKAEDVLGRPLGNGFSLQHLLDEVASDYLLRALADANGRKKAAANLLGFEHYQTFMNWVKKLHVKY